MQDFETPGFVHTAQAMEGISQDHRSVDVGVWELDLRNNRLSWSEGVYRIFDIEPTQFGATYEAFLDRVHPEDRQRVDRAYRQHLEEKKPYGIDHRLLLPGNRIRHVYEHCHSEYAADGSPLRSIGTVIDITGRQEKEEQIRQLQKMAAIGKMSCGLLHDLNNFLTAIQSYGDLALEASLEPDTRRYMEKIQQASDRAAGLAHQLLMFSRSESPLWKPQPMKPLLESFIPLLRRLIPDNIVIDLQIADAPLPDVFGDRQRLEQVVMNLLLNARDAMYHGGTITVKLDSQHLTDSYAATLGLTAGLHLKLSVSDTGCGIADGALPVIYEPFFTTREDGTGLGLAITYEIVRQHYGSIEVSSRAWQGTHFHVYLPIAGNVAHKTPPRALLPLYAGGSESILIVEDDKAVLDVTAIILTSLGYRVLMADTVEEAERLAADPASTVNLLLTDVVMPGGSGMQLACRLRARQADLKVLYMSGYAKVTPDICEGDSLAAFMAKPLRPAMLANHVRQLLDREPACSHP